MNLPSSVRKLALQVNKGIDIDQFTRCGGTKGGCIVLLFGRLLERLCRAQSISSAKSIRTIISPISAI